VRIENARGVPTAKLSSKLQLDEWVRIIRVNRQRTHVEARSNDNWNTFRASRASIIRVVQIIGD